MKPLPKARPSVLFATDLEGDIEEGLRVASQFAADRSAVLLIVHVVALRPSDGEGMLHHVTKVRTCTRRMMGLRPSNPMVDYVALTLAGKPEDELTRVAEQYGVQLVVLEARKAGVVARVMGEDLGQRLGTRIQCPIVTYQPRATRNTDNHSFGLDSVASKAPFSALQATLDARAEAALDWLDGRRAAASLLVQHTSVQSGIADLVQEKVGAEERLTVHLREHLWAAQALGIEVWICEPGASADPRTTRALTLGLSTEPGAERERWMDSVRREGAAVSLPFLAGGHAPVVLAGARVELFGGRHAVVGLVVDARSGLLRILSQPGPTPSAETYAFDEKGFFRSYTRFPEHLRRMGIQASVHQTPEHVRVCDPGKGKFSSQRGNASGWPLTRMALSATAGDDGSDDSGYRDYRGVLVVGAWRWVDRYEFGIAAEMDLSHVQN